MEPLILVVGRRLPQGEAKPWPDQEALAVPTPYLEAIRRAGGEPAALLPQAVDRSAADRLLDRFEGLLLIGGSDVDPARYGHPEDPACYGIDPERDAFELTLARAAVDRALPTLAVCRGIQVVNVSMGGTLDQHITNREGVIAHGVPARGHGVSHPVELEPGTMVAKAMGIDRPDCFSHHHQAIERVGDGLRPVGWTEDGIVEAVELDDGWTLGVQWHPEETAHKDPAQQGLFDALVERAGQLPGGRDVRPVTRWT
jgi:putative glutamine amidotransferase